MSTIASRLAFVLQRLRGRRPVKYIHMSWFNPATITMRWEELGLDHFRRPHQYLSHCLLGTALTIGALTRRVACDPQSPTELAALLAELRQMRTDLAGYRASLQTLPNLNFVWRIDEFLQEVEIANAAFLIGEAEARIESLIHGPHSLSVQAVAASLATLAGTSRTRPIIEQIKRSSPEDVVAVHGLAFAIRVLSIHRHGPENHNRRLIDLLYRLHDGDWPAVQHSLAVNGHLSPADHQAAVRAWTAFQPFAAPEARPLLLTAAFHAGLDQLTGVVFKCPTTPALMFAPQQG